MGLYPTQKAVLTALVSPANAANKGVIFISSNPAAASGLVSGDKVISWSSSNKRAVTVSRTGKLKAAKKTGKSVITVRTRYGAKASCIVTVQKKKVISVTVK